MMALVYGLLSKIAYVWPGALHVYFDLFSGAIQTYHYSSNHIIQHLHYQLHNVLECTRDLGCMFDHPVCCNTETNNNQHESVADMGADQCDR